MTGGRPTVRDVAAHAEVSVATVSFVLNGRDAGRVSEPTRRRVLAAAHRLGYAPDSAARNLRRGHTDLVCLLVGSIGVPANDRLARDLHAAADDAGHGVITLVVDSPARARQAVDLLHQRIADGALVAPSVPFLDSAELDALASGGLPLVVMSNTVRPVGFDVVRTTESDACAEALDHLFATGRRRIAHLAHRPSPDSGAPLERTAAYLDALRRHGVEPAPGLLVPAVDDRVAAYRATTELLALDEPPDAVFAASDRAAVSAIWALRDAGRRVPDDVAVIGVGNLAEGLVCNPPLTTVGDPAQDYSGPVRLLFDRLPAPEPTTAPALPAPAREITIPWTVIHRGSA